MITWLMGAWLVYHIIAALHFYGTAAATPASFEVALHQELAVLDVGALLGSGGPTFVITYGAPTAVFCDTQLEPQMLFSL